MPSKSKTKGNGFERDVCKYLNELTGLNFTRVPNSGAFLGGKNQVRVEGMTDSQTLIFDGDIIVPDEWSKWSLECKFYKDISWKKLFQPEGVAQLNGWIEQSKVTSKPNWMLFFKINNCGAYIVIDTKALKNYNFKKPSCVMTYRNDYIIVDMKTFLEENYKEIAK
jgi:hypothetical protein